MLLSIIQSAVKKMEKRKNKISEHTMKFGGYTA